MTEFLPESVREALIQARKAAERRKSRMRVESGEVSVRVLRSWQTGFAVDAEEAVQLRGLVDLYDGGRHVSRCLIVTSREEDGERVYEIKRSTEAADHAPLDFERPDNAPFAYLPRPDA